ncbi:MULTISPECIES: DUF2752 domain-containing protein [Streptomyces]|uniref:DUF2752 domain-containing protein n=1 Tax=Streptomyces TaxID=1883 RepID=UPI00062C45F2|nr:MULTISPECIES: DUF2752 domain-containing protein [Streptomyces]KND41382.1 hypothetical protein IQ64_29670 [Streptomyces stelliscabiei]MDX2518175.1 DUF2752 domain-containing protein [Streptomyces stelliscabiei]MDX2555795.1 DUF2752 domain-containing protein [Streptomyces stelliscabiei]MDX2614218.1 DUF2752 domain-containing protein [Streptomyces stelliscabiei]MDX2633644.1 DUF2752 domain-containing protein [Streptomyces stelliscabiei]
MRCVNADTQPTAPPPRLHGAEPVDATVATGGPPRTTGRTLRALAVPAGVLAAVGGAFAYVAAVDPNEPGHYPVCPLWRLTGLYCPGCGGLRSAHAFAHGDLATALTDNALAVVGFLGFAVLWTVWVVRTARGRSLRLRLGPVQLWSLGASALVFTVVRNLPFGGWLHP